MHYPLDRQDAILFLESEGLMVLATAGNDGIPRATTVFYVADEQLNLYFAMYKQSKKAKNIEENANASVAIGVQPMNIQATGTVQQIFDEELIDRMFTALSKKAADSKLWPPLLSISTEAEYLLFKFTPSEMRAINTTSTTLSSDESPYISILEQ